MASFRSCLMSINCWTLRWAATASYITIRPVRRRRRSTVSTPLCSTRPPPPPTTTTMSTSCQKLRRLPDKDKAFTTSTESTRHIHSDKLHLRRRPSSRCLTSLTPSTVIFYELSSSSLTSLSLSTAWRRRASWCAPFVSASPPARCVAMCQLDKVVDRVTWWLTVTAAPRHQGQRWRQCPAFQTRPTSTLTLSHWSLTTALRLYIDERRLHVLIDVVTLNIAQVSLMVFWQSRPSACSPNIVSAYRR